MPYFLAVPPLPFMAPLILNEMGGFSNYGAKPSLILLSL
jgi:hypothetical protein